MGGEYIFYMLDDAITLLPETKLRKVVESYLDLTEPYSDGTENQGLLVEGKAFQAASQSGSYYNGAARHGKNREENPIETLAWIADCRRLLGRCTKQAAKHNQAAEVCQAFEIVFGLLDHIDLLSSIADSPTSPAKKRWPSYVCRRVPTPKSGSNR